MTKKAWIIIVLTAFMLLALLFIPVKRVYDDGGTVEYAALMYRVVKWNKLNMNDAGDRIDRYESTTVYWFPNSLKSIDELWELENAK